MSEEELEEKIKEAYANGFQEGLDRGLNNTGMSEKLEDFVKPELNISFESSPFYMVAATPHKGIVNYRMIK